MRMLSLKGGAGEKINIDVPTMLWLLARGPFTTSTVVPYTPKLCHSLLKHKTSRSRAFMNISSKGRKFLFIYEPNPSNIYFLPSAQLGETTQHKTKQNKTSFIRIDTVLGVQLSEIPGNSFATWCNVNVYVFVERLEHRSTVCLRIAFDESEYLIVNYKANFKRQTPLSLPLAGIFSLQ